MLKKELVVEESYVGMQINKSEKFGFYIGRYIGPWWNLNIGCRGSSSRNRTLPHQSNTWEQLA